jgi:choline dehydrogenase-like flavoprotein
MQAPLIDPNFLADRDDMDRMVRGFRIMRNLLAQPALAGYRGQELAASAAAQTDEQIEQFIRNHGDTIYHPVGSCRMGPGPMDVVDAQLRVHGIQGLRVVDASIMPRVVGGNTNAPTIMIAEKAVDMIAREADSLPPGCAQAANRLRVSAKRNPERHHRVQGQHHQTPHRVGGPLVHEQGAYQLYRIGQR